MTQAQIEENYNVSCDFLYYNGLRLSIPQGWLEHHTINRAAFVCLSVCLSVCLFPISSEVL